MASTGPLPRADRGQRRAHLVQARSQETKRALVQAAVALWRTNGYAGTTVADICKAAGVSKALFWFYFPRKEDVLLEAGVLSTREARRRARELVTRPYTVDDVVAQVLAVVETQMRRNPPELVVESVLEGYRHEQRMLAEGRADGRSTSLFLEFFERAQADGKLPAGLDVDRLARVAQSLMADGARQWAAGYDRDRGFAPVVAQYISALVAGISRPASSPTD